MIDRDKVFDAFRNCITEPKCKDCPWEQCEQFNQKKVEIPVTLALDVIELLKDQEAVKPRTENDGAPQPWTSWWYVCGNCKASISPNDKYCHECGKAVKWNETVI